MATNISWQQKVSQFLIWCSGAQNDILANIKIENSKYWSIGAAVFLTSVLAFFSGSYAIYFVFNSVAISILCGIIWGLVIFNLDRFLVLSTNVNGSFLSKATNFFFRLVLAFFISFVISKPIEIKLFEKEIKAKQLSDALFYNNSFETTKNEIRKDSIRIDNNTSFISALDTIIIKKGSALEAEIQGRVGSRIKGDGPSAKAIRETIADCKERQSNVEIETSKLKSRIDENRKKLAEINLSFAAVNANNSLVSFLYYLSLIKRENSSIFFIGLFINILFILVEILPVLIKFLSANGLYEYELLIINNEKRNPEIRQLRLQYEIDTIEAREKSKYNVYINELHINEQFAYAENEINKRVELALLEKENNTRIKTANITRIPFGGMEFYISYKKLKVDDLNKILETIYRIYNIILFIERDVADSEWQQLFESNQKYLKGNSENDLQIASIYTGNSVILEFASGFLPTDLKEFREVTLGGTTLILTFKAIEHALKSGINIFKEFQSIIKTHEEIKELRLKNKKLALDIDKKYEDLHPLEEEKRKLDITIKNIEIELAAITKEGNLLKNEELKSTIEVSRLNIEKLKFENEERLRKNTTGRLKIEQTISDYINNKQENEEILAEILRQRNYDNELEQRLYQFVIKISKTNTGIQNMGTNTIKQLQDIVLNNHEVNDFTIKLDDEIQKRITRKSEISKDSSTDNDSNQAIEG